MMGGKVGRPTKCTPEAIATAERYFKAGATARIVCDALLISETAFYEWMQRGKKGEEPFRTFAERVKLASAEGALSSLEGVGEADKGWQASAWMLERRWGYYKTERIEQLNPPEQANDAPDLSTDEGRAKLAEQLAALPPDVLAAAIARQNGESVD